MTVRVAGHPYELLASADLDLIHRSALRILREVGLEVQNQRLLTALADFGLIVDRDPSRQRAYYPTAVVERFLAEADQYDWNAAVPSVSASAGVYHGLYHDPQTGQLVPWTEGALIRYFALARRLTHIGSAQILGCRLPVPGELEPLYERYYAWKYGAADSGSIHLDELCPYILELYQIVAALRGLPLTEVFDGTVYLVPPLRLGRHEAYQVAYFWERGLRVHIGDMYAMGANAPVTLAGAVTLNLAERLALGILDWALFGIKRFHLSASISVMDMRTMIYPYGRPEMAIANLMTAQLARRYGASFSGHAGLTDAKLPSVEAGAQKALTAIPTLLAGGHLHMDAGLLSIDEVCSPIQMVLDNEFLSALKHFTQDFPVDEEAIGIETIEEAGPGGAYIDKPHTARRFRKEHWQPAIWSRQMTGPWLADGCPLDADKAREFVLEDARQPGAPSFMSEEMEREILSLIEQAKRALVAQP